MTDAEYLARREAILKQISAPQDVRGPGGMGVTNRSVDDLRKSLATLDADYAAAGSTNTRRVIKVFTSNGL